MKFKIAVGDWSDDGHGKCDYFLVNTNCENSKEIKEAYDKIKTEFKLDISSIASEYEDNTLEEKDYLILKNLGFKFNGLDFEFMIDPSDDEDEEDSIVEVYICAPIAMAKIVVFMLNKVNPQYDFNLIEDENTMTIYASGYGLYS